MVISLPRGIEAIRKSVMADLRILVAAIEAAHAGDSASVSW